jgi:hypothetical protein
MAYLTILLFLLGWAAASLLFILLLAGINRLFEREPRRKAEIRMHEVRRQLELNQLSYEVRADAVQARTEIDRELREQGR